MSGYIFYFPSPLFFLLPGFEKRRCESDAKWKPEAATCTETLCKMITPPENGNMTLTTLRIGGKANFWCTEGFALKGDDDIECLSSGSWSSWPPTCVEIDCGQPGDIDEGRVYLVNGSTKIGSVAEYHCFPGFERNGPFERVCLEDAYWSGREPSCARPKPITILSDNTIDGTRNVRAGPRSNLANGSQDEPSSVGMWIGVALGLIVVLGLLILGLYFYRKQKAITSKPPPYRDRNANGGAGAINGGYAGSGVYTSAASGAGGPLPPTPNGAGGGGGGVGNPTAMIGPRIGVRPPPPIQMYSMQEDQIGEQRGVNGAGAGGPIYDTINDDNSSGSGYERGSSKSGVTSVGGGGPYNHSTTFSPHNGGGRMMPPYNEYDVPEGSERGGPAAGTPGAAPATVTINGIAV